MFAIRTDVLQTMARIGGEYMHTKATLLASHFQDR